MKKPNAWRLFVGLVLLMTCSASHAGPRHTRMSLQEFVQDPARVETLRRGVAEMKRRDSAPKDSAEYRTSWEYWANIHGYLGPVSPIGTVAQLRQFLIDEVPGATNYIGFLDDVPNITPPPNPPGLAQKVWATCEHGAPEQPNDFFLPWHRMYLYFFERVLRKASGDENFALPYWDYTNNTPYRDAAGTERPEFNPWRLSAIFVRPRLGPDPSSPPNPLYAAKRTAFLGLTTQVDPLVTNVDSLLRLTALNAFQQQLDVGIHGAIHCTVGNACLSPYMGLVPLAANDPIFWHHHANIDRLWSCWMERNGTAKLPSWASQRYTFVNEDGNEQSIAIEDLFKPDGPIDYTYDNVTNCFRVPPPETPVVTMAAGESSRSELTSAESVRLQSADEVVPLKGTLGAKVATEAAGPKGRAILKLQGVSSAKGPGAVLRVFLASSDGKQREFAGLVSFFGAQIPHAHRESKEKGVVTFDVTDQVAKLAQGSPEGLAVAFVASSGLTGDEKAVEAKNYQAADVRIEKVTLEIEGAGPANR